MALKSLSFSLSLSSLSLPNQKLSSHSTLKTPKNDHNPILYKSTQTTTTLQTSSEPEGTGSSAPTRGEVFLQYQKSVTATKTVLKEHKQVRKKGKKEIESRKLSNVGITSCYGCGAPLQTSESDAPGFVYSDMYELGCELMDRKEVASCYGCGVRLQISKSNAPGFVDLETYELKKKHHQLNTVLCGRCKLLSHGHMITAVGGNGGYAGGKQFVTAEELREKLSHLRHEKALIVKLVDIVDFNGSFLAHVRDLAGANPIILVVTKVDLLPKGTDLNCVGDWVVEATVKKKLNVLSVHLTSSKSLVGMAGVTSEIQREKKGRNVYILGSANVGKSAFINALLKRLAEKDPIAAAAQKYRPIQSAVPGTTLGPIQIEAFLGGGKIYDTPGVHLHHRQTAVVHSEDLPALAPQNRLRGQSFHVADDGKIKSNGLMGFSIFWGGLVRIDILKALPQTGLTFYGPKALQIHLVPTNKATEFYQKQVGSLLTPPTGKQRDDWMGLETERQLQIKFEDLERPACDVAISGLGWIAVEPLSQSFGTPSENIEETSGEIHLAVHVPKPVEIFVRSPLPVSKAGGERYRYRDLTEKEQEERPKWYI